MEEAKHKLNWTKQMALEKKDVDVSRQSLIKEGSQAAKAQQHQ